MKPSKGAAGHALKTMERKRKSDFNAHDISEDDKPAKKLKKTAALPVRKASTVAKTPKTHKKRKSDDTPSSGLPSRKSTRMSNAAVITYADRDSDEDDAEMLEAEKASAQKLRAKAVPSASLTVNGAQVCSEQLEEEKENEIQDPDEVDDNDHANQTDSASSRGTSPSPSRARTNGVTEKGKKGASSNRIGTRRTAVSGKVKSKAIAPKSPAAEKNLAPPKKAKEPVAKTRETRRTRAAAAIKA